MGGVQILLTIGMLMVVTMVSCPPEWPTLGSAGPKQAEQELGNPACLESLVGEVAMVKARDRKHSYNKKSCGKTNSERACSGHQHQQASQVERDEWKHANNIERS
jgi:hypothetical protein